MPDTWEYPWYASWVLAFHCITLALIDPEFAKSQLVLLTREWYMHPNGQLPAYEWRVLLVACEPLTFGGEEGVMGLSEPVREAVEAAVSTVEGLIFELMEDANEPVRPQPTSN